MRRERVRNTSEHVFTFRAFLALSILSLMLLSSLAVTADLSDADDSICTAYGEEAESAADDDDRGWMIYLAIAGGIVLTLVIAVVAVVYFRYYRE